MEAVNEVQQAMAWMQTRDTGVSSEAIMQTMLGVKARPDTYPSDPSDLGRCIRLLDRIPAWRARISEMGQVGYVWRSLVSHWDELEATYRAELANPSERCGPWPTFDRMKQLIAEGLEADPNVIIRHRDSKGYPCSYEARWFSD